VSELLVAIDTMPADLFAIVVVAMTLALHGVTR